MIRMTSDDLRRLADQIDKLEKYGSMCGVVYASIQYHTNGREFLQFEQPCQYADCNSTFHRFDGKESRP